MPEAKTKTFCWLFPLLPPTPLLLLPTLAPGWKPSLHLSYCFKPKFTVSVGGQDPLSPPLLHRTLRTLRLSRGWGPARLLFALAQPGRRKQGRERSGLSSHIPAGSGHVSPTPNPGLLPGGSPDPSLGPIPHHAGSVDSSKEAGQSEPLHRPPMGDPNLRPRPGCAGCS